MYEETFKFIANIIEYKIPFYLSLFVNVYLYYISVNNKAIIEDLDVTEIMTNVENMGIDKEYLDYYEYGFSKDLIEKIKSLDVELNKDNLETIDKFDNYEKIMLKEFLELIK